MGVNVLNRFRQTDSSHAATSPKRTLGNTPDAVFQCNLSIFGDGTLIFIKYGTDEDRSISLVVIPKRVVKCPDANMANETIAWKNDALKAAALVERPTANVG